MFIRTLPPCSGDRSAIVGTVTAFPSRLKHFSGVRRSRNRLRLALTRALAGALAR
jgi:hypothetical protein